MSLIAVFRRCVIAYVFIAAPPIEPPPAPVASDMANGAPSWTVTGAIPAPQLATLVAMAKAAIEADQGWANGSATVVST